MRMSDQLAVAVYQSAMLSASLDVLVLVRAGSDGGGSGGSSSAARNAGIGPGAPSVSHAYGWPVSGCGEGGRIV